MGTVNNLVISLLLKDKLADKPREVTAAAAHGETAVAPPADKPDFEQIFAMDKRIRSDFLQFIAPKVTRRE